MKIDISKIPDILTEAQIPPQKQEEILHQIEEAIKAEKEEREENKLPKVRPELGIILLDELGELKTDNVSGLIYEVPANSNHNEVLPNIKKAISEFNNTKKGQKNPVKSIQEAFSTIKPKLFKNNGGIKKKTKEPVRCLISLNKV